MPKAPPRQKNGIIFDLLAYGTAYGGFSSTVFHRETVCENLPAKGQGLADFSGSVWRTNGMRPHGADFRTIGVLNFSNIIVLAEKFVNLCGFDHFVKGKISSSPRENQCRILS